jgi:Zn finger protein HypA/HybF involved in hydrogenase expression
MTDARLRERRFRVMAPSLRPECRLCWRTVVLGPEHIEVTEQHVYVRCPHCGGSFPIRHSDMDSLLGHETPAAS